MAAPLKPRYRILGSDIAGRVEAVGRNVKQFQPDDEIFGDLFGCSLGAFAEYVCVPKNSISAETSQYDIQGSNDHTFKDNHRSAGSSR
jgi:NADPH:quinone reductase-like Zn-dependent oxidoreductase